MGFRESAIHLARELRVPVVDARPTAGAVVYLCVNDDAIAALLTELDERLPAGAAIVHASGTASLPLLERPTGVLWPVQSITADVEPDWTSLPFVTQASGTAFAKTLHDVAASLSAAAPTAVADDATRQRLHLGACFTQNFTNLLWDLTAEVLADAKLDYRSLLPLAANHIEKLRTAPPSALQTGPAARGDDTTIVRHLEALLPHADAHEVYARLSAMIERRRTR